MDEQTPEATADQAAADYVEQVRTARVNARRAARSGNPAKRAEAESVVRAANGIIRAVNLQARQS
jgi:hypothetical protein